MFNHWSRCRLSNELWKSTMAVTAHDMVGKYKQFILFSSWLLLLLRPFPFCWNKYFACVLNSCKCILQLFIRDIILSVSCKKFCGGTFMNSVSWNMYKPQNGLGRSKAIMNAQCNWIFLWWFYESIKNAFNRHVLYTIVKVYDFLLFNTINRKYTIQCV